MKLKPLLLSLLLVIIPIGITYADFQDGWKAYNLKDFKTAFSEWESLAESGKPEPEAQLNLGVLYEKGNGVEQDYKKSVYWYRKAAERGYDLAERYLGVMYEDGKGVEQDDTQAVYWYRKSAEQGNAPAQKSLGWAYSHGTGVEQDDTQAVYWYRKAAEQGNTPAQNNLGLMYEDGRGVEQDYKKAVYWYRKAAEQSNYYAQSNLGTMYRDGKGVEQNYKKAAYWYTMSIADGSITTQAKLITQVKIDRLNKRIAKEEKEQHTKALLVSILLMFILVAAKDKIKTKFEQYRAKTKTKTQAKDEAYAISVAEARKKAEEEAKIKAEAAEEEARIKAEKKARIIAEDEARKKAKAAEEEARIKAEEEKKLAKEKLDSDLINLHNSLPFYTRNKSDEFSSTNGDDSRWFFVLEAIKKCYTDDTTLYFVKVKSLNDDNEYYKIGVTTQSIASRFLKSTDSELVEIIASRLMEKRLALFAEFHFIREFRPKESPNEGKGFSGYTEIVKENSIRKIKSLFSTLPEYEAKASSFLTQALTDKS